MKGNDLGGPIPQKLAKTFDGPPTLERSGSEHRVGRFTSFLLRRKAWLEVELPLAKGRRRKSKKQYHHVTAVDVIPEKVEKLNNKISPIQDDYIEKYCYIAAA